MTFPLVGGPFDGARIATFPGQRVHYPLSGGIPVGRYRRDGAAFVWAPKPVRKRV